MGAKTTKFGFSYPELEQRGDYVHNLYVRDEQVFLSLGFPAAFKDDLRSKVDAFKAIEPDEYWKGVQFSSSESRKAFRKVLTRSLDLFQLRLKLLLGDNSTDYRSFQFSGTSRMNEEELVRYARGLFKTAERFSDVIAASDGLDTFITEVKEDVEELDEAIDRLREVMTQRDAASLVRVEKANELYDEIARVCDAGKRYWNGENEAYYNDYVIYGSSTPLPNEEEEETPADGDAADTTSGDEPVA
ncbi:hypothetical protein [Prolixibacter denitrificans]|uniref:Uncharacterized protein n=1 Tax=Prolixibacter denitrificans TaxID=1541063 RepID=A0A2P8CBA2_9BACT|nr:hypothetical protein [Prolixibacter denitrificans]PSK82260.1 hypothetical protein CLV93_1063 [Prolixibacter denitrificans]GET22991.1 hypothetical protein JCM18694_32370 [Prolixibacter denitrificans]